MNRRNFFKIIAGLAAAPLAVYLPAAKADDPVRRALDALRRVAKENRELASRHRINEIRAEILSFLR